MGTGCEVAGRDLPDHGHRVEDCVQLLGIVGEGVIGQIETGEPSQMGDLVAGDGGHVPIVGVTRLP